MKKKLLVVIALAAMLLTGCSSDAITETGTGTGGSLKTYNVDLPDGGTVLCVIFAAGYKGGLSCDWDEATR